MTVKRYGWAISDLPEGALGMPSIVLDEMWTWTDIIKESTDASSDAIGGEQCDSEDRL